MLRTMLLLVEDQLAVSELMLSVLTAAGMPESLVVGAAARLDQLRAAARQARELLIAAELAPPAPVRIVAVGGRRTGAAGPGRARRRPRR